MLSQFPHRGRELLPKSRGQVGDQSNTLCFQQMYLHCYKSGLDCSTDLGCRHRAVAFFVFRAGNVRRDGPAMVSKE